MTTTGTTPPSTGARYDAEYYAHHCGGVYERNEAWTTFFGAVADHIIADLNPVSVLDVGCALGFLVEALRDRGVDAHGIDVSEYAVAHARDDMTGYVILGSALEPFARRYDLITCIEVLEHLPPAEAQQAVDNLCAHTDHVLFTSTPHDYSEETHVNVRPPEHWAGLFGRRGLFRDVDYDASYLVPWATHFRRLNEPPHVIAANYERVLWQARHELSERNKVVLAQMHQADESRGQQAELIAVRSTVSQLRDEMRTLELSLADRDARVSALDNEGQLARARMAQLDAAMVAAPVRAALRLSGGAEGLLRHAAPQHSRRREALRLARRAGAIISAEGPRGLVRRINGRRTRLAGRPLPASQGQTSDDAQYAKWLDHHDPTVVELNEMLVENSRWSYRPLVSVVVPVFNPPEVWLDHMIGSVLGQVYANWELSIADDCSPAPHVRAALERWAALDERIKITYRERNGNIAAASNTALEAASGEYVALLDHDDILRPHALHRMVNALQSGEPVDVLYSDEDKILLNGSRGQAHFKGSFDPDYLLSTNYICHLSMFRRELLNTIGGFRTGLDGSQDHDIALRATEKARAVRHVPDVLYSWKQVPGSAALDISAKPAAWEAGRRAAEDALVRREESGRVELGPHAGLLVARYAVPQHCKAAVVICAEGSGALEGALGQLRSVLVENTRFVVATHNADLASTLDRRIEVVLAEPPINRSRLINQVVSTLHEDVVVLLGVGLVPTRRGNWLTPLLEQACRQAVGVAGARIVTHDGAPLEEGIRVGGPSIAESVGVRWPVIQRVAAVSAQCFAVRREVLEELGGFDEAYRVSLFDVDLCLRARRHGLAVVYTPLTELRRVLPLNDLGHGRDDAAVFKARWDGAPDLDPFVSPWLDRVHPFSLRVEG